MPSVSHLQLRLKLLLLIILLVPAAYWLRFFAPFGGRLRDGTGGAAYVLFWSAVFLGVAPRRSPLRIAGEVLLVTCGLEFLQLWHPPWLEAARRNLAGRLILGTTFDWSDFPPYFAGTLLSCIVLRLISRNSRIKTRLSAIQQR